MADLAVVDSRAAVAAHSISDVQHLAAAAFKAGWCGVKSAEEALIRMVTGCELGLSPMQALRGIYVLNGKPALYADAMIAVVLQSPACEYFLLTASTDAIATYETKRKGAPKPTTMSFTLEEAKRAGLLRNPTWGAYPAAMLRARAATALARVVYPDVCAGLYDPEELESASPPPAPSRVEAKPTPAARQAPTEAPALPAAVTIPDAVVESVAERAVDSAESGFRLQLEDANSDSDLANIAAEIKSAKLPADVGKALREAFKAAKARIALEWATKPQAPPAKPAEAPASAPAAPYSSGIPGHESAREGDVVTDPGTGEAFRFTKTAFGLAMTPVGRMREPGEDDE